jgi:CubicO group peptidase (beta-lactamase class C family)
MSPSYSNIAFSVLYQALKRVSGGKSYQDLISQDILKPLKMQDTTTRLPFSDAIALANWLKRGAIAVGSEGAYGLDFGAEFGDPYAHHSISVRLCPPGNPLTRPKPP